MAVTTYAKPILPKLYPASASIVRAKIKRTTRDVCEKAAVELRELVSTWNHQPQPVVAVTETPTEIKGSAITDDAVMFYLDGGTRERWALMSNPFEAKTKHRSLRSGAGVGGPVITGRGAMTRAGMNSQPGIAKREFSKELKDKLGPVFSREIDKVMADAITKGQAKP
jgi:hypothetical protein